MVQPTFRVDLQALADSAAQVSAQGEDLASAHLASDNRITTVQSGWVGASAAALSAKTATWLQASHGMLARIGAHALDLNNDAIKFAALERDNVRKLHVR
jgi:WXG100 family type VII secretion target